MATLKEAIYIFLVIFFIAKNPMIFLLLIVRNDFQTAIDKFITVIDAVMKWEDEEETG